MKNISVPALISAVLFFAMTGTLAAEELFSGNLYRMGTNRGELLFRQFNEIETESANTRISHRYELADGTPYALEEVVRENGEFKNYRVDFYLLETSGSIERDGDEIRFTYQAGGDRKRSVYRYQDDLLCGPCLIGFVQGNWERLMRGKPVRFHLPVLEYQRTIPFRIRKVDESRYAREGRVVLRMEIANFLLDLLLGSVDFVFDGETRRLVEIHGPSVLKVEEEGVWRSVDVDAYYTYERMGALRHGE
jgi:hypothetical protein